MPHAQEHKHTNQLINETSPYLLQHAHNPVEWYPWNDATLAKAKKEDKPILVSIGYSTCHWCHVMEHESFEDEAVAKVMNKKFICIKVDREERPDIDQVYMEAVQMMGLRGGWPLNVFLTSGTKPFYGGTYFPKDRWISLLNQIADAYVNQKEEVITSSEKFVASLGESEAHKFNLKAGPFEAKKEDLDVIFNLLEKRFDTVDGGTDKEPKFPMPSIYRYLLSYYSLTGNQRALKQATLTLTKMAQGGIYDQIGGGFARYSTDGEWLAPHFEKMLYDNGQLVSLYSEGYQLTKDPLFKTVVEETLEYIGREMTNSEGGFYSALDADSEGEEGKFYVWEYAELEKILGNDIALFADYYDVAPAGNWEGVTILRNLVNKEAFCKAHSLNIDDFEKKVKNWKAIILKERSKRIRPGLDDKCLTSWNGLMLKGYLDAYRALGNEAYLKKAIKNGEFIESKLLNGNTLLRTYKDGRAKIDGFLEDYAITIDAFTHLYQLSFDEKWLTHAKALADYAMAQFYDSKEHLFFYSGRENEKLIATKKELFDNVIPSSNSIMATNLYFLGAIYPEESYGETAEKMLSVIHPMLSKEPSYLTHWASLYSYYLYPTAEVVVSGDHSSFLPDLTAHYLTNAVLLKAQKGSTLPLVKDKISTNKKPTLFVCYNKTCQLPVSTVKEALKQIKAAK